jgi:hypothetical protein
MYCRGEVLAPTVRFIDGALHTLYVQAGDYGLKLDPSILNPIPYWIGQIHLIEIQSCVKNDLV